MEEVNLNLSLQAFSAQLTFEGGGAVSLAVGQAPPASLAVLRMGEKGDAGPQGDRGDIGLQGERGPAGVGFDLLDKQSEFNKFRHCGVGISYSGSTVQTVSGRLICYIIRLPSHKKNITQCQIQCGGAGPAGAVMHVGIYSVGTEGDLGGHNEHLLSSCVFDISTTGVKQASLNAPVFGDGNLVVLAIYTNGAASVRGFGIVNNFMSTIQDGIYNNFGDIAKFSSGLSLQSLPEYLPALSGVTSSSSMPFVALGVS